LPFVQNLASVTFLAEIYASHIVLFADLYLLLKLSIWNLQNDNSRWLHFLLIKEKHKQPDRKKVLTDSLINLVAGKKDS
jgi:hypothetical protein